MKPKQLKIGSHKFAIKYKNLTKEEADNNSGYACVVENKIVINDSLPLTQQESTLLHEIIEVINFQYQLKLDHNIIMTLETALYQVLKDNKLRF